MSSELSYYTNQINTDAANKRATITSMQPDNAGAVLRRLTLNKDPALENNDVKIVTKSFGGFFTQPVEYVEIPPSFLNVIVPATPPTYGDITVNQISIEYDKHIYGIIKNVTSTGPTTITLNFQNNGKTRQQRTPYKISTFNTTISHAYNSISDTITINILTAITGQDIVFHIFI